MDSVLKKQFEAFGIDYTQNVEDDGKPRRKPVYSQSIITVVSREMDTYEGREHYFYLLTLCGVSSTPFVSGYADATGFACGMQEVGHHIQNLINIASTAGNYVLMLQEASARLHGEVEPKET